MSGASALREPPTVPNPRVTHGARRHPVDEALDFLRANRDTHTRWAEYFEQNPAVEAEYLATGVWEGAADQRRIERQYNAAISTFEALWRTKASNEASISVESSPKASIPSAVLDAVAFAIERARCSGREGPFGGYDYGHNPDFYGPEPEGGRYVVRDFRDFRSPTWGKWVHQTHDKDEHEQAYLRLTGRHIAEAAIRAYLAAEANNG